MSSQTIDKVMIICHKGGNRRIRNFPVSLKNLIRLTKEGQERKMKTYQEEWRCEETIHLYQEFNKYVPKAISAIADGIKERCLQKIEGLDIGGGNGDSSLELIDLLQRQNIEVIAWNVLDVSRVQLQIFKARTVNIPKPNFSFRLDNWAEFPLNKQYDFVLARHSWYGIAERQNEPTKTTPLIKLCRAIKNRGTALIIIESREGIMTPIANSLRGNKYRISGEDICRELESLKIEYECNKLNLPLPILLENNKITKEGHGIYRYILNMKDISSVKTRLEEHLTNWFEKHKEWFSQICHIWIDKKEQRR